MTTGSEYFVRIKDGETDNQLFSGSEIILHINTIKFSGGLAVSVKEKGFQDTSLTDADNNSIGSNYNRRKSNASFKGFNNPVMTIAGMMSIGGIGSDTITINEGGTAWTPVPIQYKVLTPTRLMMMVVSGHKFYLNDTNIIKYLKTVDSDGNQFYTGSGMPVAITAWGMDPVFDDSNNGVKFNLAFIEDKD